MSPDPLGGDILNPQSLNRYTYVMNNPTNWADPSGAAALPTYDQLMGESLSIDGLGGGMDCTADGADTSCGTVDALMEANGGVQCPDNNCGEGTPTPFQCAASVCGYMTTQYLSTHENVCGSMLCTNLGYAEYEIATNQNASAEQYYAVAKALADKLGISVDSAMEILDRDMADGQMYLQGGNLNFAISGNDEFVLCSGPAGCRLDDGLHIRSVGGSPYVHLDTVDPFTSPGNFFEHGFVDLFLGNAAYNITPRPW